MKKLIFAFVLSLCLPCLAGAASGVSAAAEYAAAEGVVFRGTQCVYSAEADEYIYFYSSGKVAVCTNALGQRLEGTYTMEDNRTGISITIDGRKYYCRITLSKAGELMSMTFRNVKYVKH